MLYGRMGMRVMRYATEWMRAVHLVDTTQLTSVERVEMIVMYK
jgi:hypothetical protein